MTFAISFVIAIRRHERRVLIFLLKTKVYHFVLKFHMLNSKLKCLLMHIYMYIFKFTFDYRIELNVCLFMRQIIT